uniref:Mechanosensitive ion channel family protein n=1 Tax=Fervidicoccus fontis TaxID=683846 RepID=A0A7J3ZK92_9CREN
MRVRIVEAVAAGAIVVASVLVALFVRSAMRRRLRPRLPIHAYKPLENLAFYGIVITGIFLALVPFEISLASLLVAGGFAGIVVGFASQQTVSNFISGVFLLLEQPLRIGDPVAIGEIGGTVLDVSILSTKIRTWEGYIVRIPNSVVFNSSITNYVKTRARRVEITIGISYDSNIEKAREILVKMMQEHPYCLVNPAPEAFVDSYADSAVVLKARCWAPPSVWFAAKVDLQTRMKKTLEEAGIKIPFPQLDVHIKDATDIRVKLANEQDQHERTSVEGRGGDV